MHRRYLARRALGVGRWVVLLAAMVVSGCGASGPAPPRSGRALFAASGCGSCHTLAAAGATGVEGPDLDTSELLDRAQILQNLTAGVGGMPSYRGSLTPAELDRLTEFVYGATHARRGP